MQAECLSEPLKCIENHAVNVSVHLSIYPYSSLIYLISYKCYVEYSSLHNPLYVPGLGQAQMEHWFVPCLGCIFLLLLFLSICPSSRFIVFYLFLYFVVFCGVNFFFTCGGWGWEGDFNSLVKSDFFSGHHILAMPVWPCYSTKGNLLKLYIFPLNVIGSPPSASFVAHYSSIMKVKQKFSVRVCPVRVKESKVRDFQLLPVICASRPGRSCLNNKKKKNLLLCHIM